MRLYLLGTGGPKPDAKRQGPCLAVQVGERFVLIDAGRGAGTQLAAAGIPIARIDPVLITHHHYDHTGDLADIMLSSWNLGRRDRLSIMGPAGVVDLVDVLLNRAYKRDIEFRMTEAGLSGVSLVDIGEIVEARDISPGLVFEDDSLKIFAEYVQHGHGLGISQNQWKCLGYRLEAEGKSIAVSGDATACPGLETLARGVDLLVMCCYLAESELIDRESELIAEHILSCSPQVGQIAAGLNPGKLVLTHFREKSDVLIAEMVKEIGARFNGEVVAGYDLLMIDV